MVDLFPKVFNDIKSVLISLRYVINLPETRKIVISCGRLLSANLSVCGIFLMTWQNNNNDIFVNIFFVNKERKVIIDMKNSLVIKKKL